VSAPAHAQSTSTLPSHFAFGLEAGPADTWLPRSGVPWDYRWQYLAGGVNTGKGWETWNSNGTFASGEAYFDLRQRADVSRRLTRRLERLGYRVKLEPLTSAA